MNRDSEEIKKMMGEFKGTALGLVYEFGLDCDEAADKLDLCNSARILGAMIMLATYIGPPSNYRMPEEVKALVDTLAEHMPMLVMLINKFGATSKEAQATKAAEEREAEAQKVSPTSPADLKIVH